jgi:preprotein translocase subunit SecE
MAKVASNRSAGSTGKAQKAPTLARGQSAPKAPAKQAGPLSSAFSRVSSRSSASRATASTAPRGTVSTKPRGRVRTFFREVRIEMSKVTWPPRKELLKSTGVVIIAVVIAGVFIGVFDFIWNLIVRSVGMG